MTDPFSIAGLRVVITGGAKGIGEGIASHFIEMGARVATIDLRHGSNNASLAIAADITDEHEVKSTFARVDNEFGGLDVLINNAGITHAEDIFATSLESWNEVLNVNLNGAFLCAREAMTRMRDQRMGGRIIQLGSMVGHQGALKGHLHYSASKSAIHGMTKTLARTGAPFRITVNTLAPGIVDTTMLDEAHGSRGKAELATQVPLGRLATVKEIAYAAQFLSSDAAAYITGATIDINGGMHMR